MREIVFFFVLVSSTLHAQEYKELDTSDYSNRLAFIEKLDQQQIQHKKQIKKKYKGVIRKEVQKTSAELFKSFKKDVTEKKLVFDPKFNNYTNSILSDIVSANPELKDKDLKISVAKYNEPNALSLLNGYIIVNMGLFKYLENEAQFAAVICHELAHHQLDHMEQNVFFNASQIKDGKLKKQANEIKRNKYNRNDKAINALKDHLFTNSKRYRFQEKQADSSGLALFKNTKYPDYEFVNALKVFAEMDSLPDISIEKADYRKIFNLSNASFKEEWLEMESYDRYNYDLYKEKINKDSLRTHPEMVERIDLVGSKSSNFENIKKDDSKVFKYDNTDFLNLQEIARNEDVVNFYYLKKYGISIYLTLYKIKKNGINPYYSRVLANNFKALYEAKKSYKLNNYIDQINPKEQNKSYQQFLSFIWNLRLNDFKTIEEHFRG